VNPKPPKTPLTKNIFSLPHRYSLQPTINLIHNVRSRVLHPVITRLLHHQRNRSVTRDIRWSLEDVGVETSADVPRDVAVERPDTRVIGGDLPYDVPTNREELDIATLRVLWVGDGDTVPLAGALMENEHVMAVQMHRVCCWRGVVDNDTNGRVGAEILDVPFRFEGKVSLVGLEEDGFVVIGTEGRVVEGPEEVVSSVNLEIDVQVTSSGGGRWGERIEGNGEGEIVVLAGSRVRHVPWFTSWSFGCICFVVIDCSKSIALRGE